MLKLGVLISGRGTNLQSLIDSCKTAGFPAEIAVVISNRPDALGLERARHHGIKALALDHKAFQGREAFERAMDDALRAEGVELVCNAGFMRILTEWFVNAWMDRQINIHPSLLPAFRGLHVHERVLASGARITGCTVHYVRSEMDAGPIIAQAAVPVLAGDKPEHLEVRVLKAEHKLYPHAVRLIAEGKVRVENECVVFAPSAERDAQLFSPELPAA